MTIKNFLKLQVFALLFAAIISPLSALAAPTMIKLVLSTTEDLNFKEECSGLGGHITGIGTGTITVNGKSTRLGVLNLTADDCITMMENYFTAKGRLTLTAGNGNNIMANYSVSFIPIDYSIYMYKDFTLQITGGTGLFTGATGFGIVEGNAITNNELTQAEGAVESTMYLK